MTMTTPDSRSMKLEWLQCVRAFSAFYVAAYHASGRVGNVAGNEGTWLERVFQFGNSGVDLFFVISGFIIAYVHSADIGRKDRLVPYAYRRVTRIYPLYWVLFIGVVPLYFVFPTSGDAYARDWSTLLNSFFLLPTPGGQRVGVAWTLVYEMLFYTGFALAILNRRAGVIIAAICLIGVVFRGVTGMTTGYYYVDVFFGVRFLGFFAGMAVAWAFRRLPELKASLWQMLLALAIFIAVPVVVRADDDSMPFYGRVLVYVAAATTILASILVERSGKIAPKALVKLGDATYSVYLFHWLIGWIYAKILQHWHIDAMLPPVVYFLSMLVLMLTGGYLVHLLIEKPLLALSRDAWRNWTVVRSAKA
jgi:peptidoglycan/LPS O-acetylase OafA/YrhL